MSPYLLKNMPFSDELLGWDAVQVADNGPGLPIAVLDRSLDYLIRISDKAHSASRSRRQRIIETDYADPAYPFNSLPRSVDTNPAQSLAP